MRKITLILALIISFYGCKSSKSIKKSTRTTVSTRPSKTTISDDDRIKTNPSSFPEVLERNSASTNATMAYSIIDYAKQFEGVRYKYGGTTKSGMDCSGLVYESFKAHDIALPRSSRDMATKGEKINIEDVQEGDLLFFDTNPRKKGVSHVGLVVTSRTGMIEFIHATTQAGVIVSSLAERYWYTSFLEARRVL